jgi:hypothetical protein
LLVSEGKNLQWSAVTPAARYSGAGFGQAAQLAQSISQLSLKAEEEEIKKECLVTFIG